MVNNQTMKVTLVWELEVEVSRSLGFVCLQVSARVPACIAIGQMYQIRDFDFGAGILTGDYIMFKVAKIEHYLEGPSKLLETEISLHLNDPRSCNHAEIVDVLVKQYGWRKID